MTRRQRVVSGLSSEAVGESICARRCARPQAAYEAFDRVIFMREVTVLNQILVDALGVAAEFDLRLDPRAVLFARPAGLIRRSSRCDGTKFLGRKRRFRVPQG